MSAATSASPSSVTPSTVPQAQPFSPPQTSATAAAHTLPATQLPSQTITQPPLPPPHTFDILPPLHALFSRLEPSLNTYTPDPIPTDALLTTQSQTGASQAPQQGASQNGLTQTTSHSSQELSYKEVVTASQFLKARMRKALAALGNLGDMDRSIEEQEDEIEALLKKIAGQREVLRVLGETAAKGMDG